MNDRVRIAGLWWLAVSMLLLAQPAGRAHEAELHAKLAEKNGADTVEYWSGTALAGASTAAAPAGVELRLPGANALPVQFLTDSRIGVVHDQNVLSPDLTTKTAAAVPEALLGYTELRTDLTGGRHANVRTMRAVVVKADGSARRLLAEGLAGKPDAWTQFAGWSPDGRKAIIARGWNFPENARWEEEHRQFRLQPGKWLLDSILVDMQTEELINVTAIERVSHYNAGLFFLPDHRTLGFTALIGGLSKPFLMDLDGRNKRDVSGPDGGFAYGYSASPDGKRISYHQDYQVFLSNPDGSNKKRIETGNPFNFGPQWSPDGQWLLFLSGIRGQANLYLVRPDGTELHKLADLNDYQGWILFFDVDDFHEGSSDSPAWSPTGKSVFYTAKVGKSVELFEIGLNGKTEQLTRSTEGTLHYHPEPSKDGQWLVYGSKREGVRQLYVMRLADHLEWRITSLSYGHAAMWPHWQPPQNSTQVP